MNPVLHSKIIGSGKPLLILHGLFGMSDNWMSLGRKFAENFQVHLIDLRNHGRSFHDDVMDYEAMTEDLTSYCTEHQLGKVSLIGHSMGGKTAMFFAVEHPEWVEKLVVADIAPKPYEDRHTFIFKALQSIDFDLLKTRKEVETTLSQHIKNQSVLQFLAKNIYHHTQDTLAFRFNREALFKNYSLLNENLPPFSQFERKTLFLKGQNSDYITSDDENVIKAHFPHAQIIEIAQAGHWLHAENPTRFFQVCMDFLLDVDF